MNIGSRLANPHRRGTDSTRSKLRNKFLLLLLSFAVVSAVLVIYPTIAPAQDAGGQNEPAAGESAPAQDAGGQNEPAVGGPAATPTIKSDKEDYPPGGLVILTGSGWRPGESVRIVVDDDGVDEQPWQRDVNVTADDDGNITDRFNLPDKFVADYTVRATGEQSGVARTTFTDNTVIVEGSDRTASGSVISPDSSMDGWRELDKVPMRITYLSGGTYETTMVVDRASTSGARYPAIQNLEKFEPASPGVVSVRLKPVGATATAWTYKVVVTLDNTVRSNAPAYVSFNAVLAAGSHNFGGASLQMRSTSCTYNLTAEACSGNAANAGSNSILSFTKPAVVVGDPDLSVTKEGPTNAGRGQEITYRLAYQNKATAASPAQGVALTDILPTGLDFVRCSDACTVTGNRTDGHDVTWSLGNLAQGTGGSRTLVVKIPADAAARTAYEDRARILSSQNDVNIADNTAVLTTTVSDSPSTSLSVPAANGTFGGSASLSATLTSNGTPLANKTVTFDLNAGRPDDPSRAGSATTNAQGVATVSSANLQGINAGQYTGGVEASFGGDTGYKGSNGLGNLTVAKANQTVSFAQDTPTQKNVGAADFTVSAAASSGLPINSADYGSDTSTVCTVSGNTVHIVGVGVCTLTAVQAGNNNYNAATGTHNISIERGTQTITFPEGTTKTYGDADFDPGATASSGGTVSYTAEPSGVCTIVDGKVHIVSAGDCAVTASQTGANYGDATARQVYKINPKTLTGSFTANDKAYDGVISVTVKATSLPGVLTGDLVNLDVTGAQFADKNVGTAKTATANLALSGAQAGNYRLSSATGTTTANITPKPLTGSFTAANKTYDGNTDARIATSDLNGKIAGDVVALAGGTASFDNKNADTGKTVTVNGAALSGADAGNYTLAQGPWTAQADITPKPLTGSFAASNKTYDGNRSAQVASKSLPGVVTGDIVNLDVTNAQFDTKNVGAGKDVAASLALSGADAGNYSLSSRTAAAKADVTKKDITGNFAASNKAYDGNASATATARTLDGTVSGDTVSLDGGTATFANKDVGNAKTVTLAGATLAGADAGNYRLTSVDNANANITAKQLTGSFTAANKTYDGNTDARIATSDLNGKIAGDVVALAGGTASFDNKNVGTGKDVTLSGANLTGADANNYNLASVGTAKADITRKDVTGSFTASNKAYDGNADATVTDRSPNGTVADDAVSLSGGNASFANKDVGTQKDVTLSGAVLSGTDAGNYNLTSVGTAKADITAKQLTGGFTASNKTYDGNRSAQVASKSLPGVVTGDIVNLDVTNAQFDTKNVGAGKDVAASLALSGADAGNYSLSSQTAAAKADINAKDIAGSFAAANKTYDGNTSATITNRSLQGGVGSDDVSLSGGTANFDTAAAGTGKTVTGTGFELSGSAAGNYKLASTTLTTNANIDKAGLTVTADDKTKTYGAANPEFTGTLTGVKNGDPITATYNSSANQQSGVGTYAIAADVDATQAVLDNYSVTRTNGALTVNKADLTVTADDKSKTYGEANPSFTGNIEGIKNNDAITANRSSSATASSGVGAYDITTTLNDPGDKLGNYDVTNNKGTLTINKADLTVTADDKEKVYGEANPSFTASYSGFKNNDTSTNLGGTLAFGTNATQQSAVGSYDVTPSGLTSGNYSITFAKGTLTVNKRAIEVTAANKSKTYGEADPTLTHSVTGGNLVNGDALTGELTRADGQNVGQYAINQGTLSANNNYSLTFKGGTLTVNKANVTVTAKNATKVYGASNPVFDVGYSGFVNGDAASDLGGTLAFDTNANAGSPVGTYDVTPSGLTSGNYNIAFAKGTLTVNEADLTVTADNATKTYGDTNPQFSGTLTGVKNNDAITASYGTTATQQSAVGTYDIVPTLNDPSNKLSNYNVTKTNGKLTVNKADLTVTADDKSKTYGEANPSFTASYFGFVNGDAASNLGGTLAFGTQANQQSGVGSYRITPSGLTSNNYAITFRDGALTVNEAALTVTANDRQKTYGDALTGADFSGEIAGIKNNDAITASYSSDGAAATSGVNTYAIVPRVNATDAVLANYQRPQLNNGTLTVKKRAITVTADTKSKTYGNPDPDLTYQVTSTNKLVNGDGFTGGLTRADGQNVGQYDISQGTLAATNNYSLTYTGAKLTIDKRSITYTADAKSKTYGNPDPELTGSITSGNLVQGDSLSGSLTRADGQNVGQYDISQGTLAATNNYSLTYTGAKLTIGKATLTVKADNKSKTYGEANPSFTASYSGFKNGETLASSSVTGQPGLSTTANASSPVRADGYAITAAQGSLASGNYSFDFQPGTLTINKAELTVTADNKSKTYGDENPTFTASHSGWKNGDSASVLSGSPALSTTATQGSNVGTYDITAAQGTLSANNYSFTFAKGTLSVNKATLTVTADNKSKTYGDENPTFTASHSGWKNGDSASVLSGSPALSTTADASSKAGTYAIAAALGTLAADNYKFVYQNGSLMVNKRDATVVYTGQNYATLASAGNATINLSAKVSRTAGGSLGDLGKARVQFTVKKFGGAVQATAYGMVDASGNAATTASVPTSDDPYTVEVQVEPANEYWKSGTDVSSLQVIVGSGTGRTAGGGWIPDDANTINGRANFGFTVANSKTGLRGNHVFIYRRVEGNDQVQYVVKSNSWQGGNLTFNVNNDPTRATFTGRATVQRYVNGVQDTTFSGGNHTFTVDDFDGDLKSPRVTDGYAIVIRDSSNAIVKQLGSRSAPVTMGGGNVLIQATR